MSSLLSPDPSNECSLVIRSLTSRTGPPTACLLHYRSRKRTPHDRFGQKIIIVWCSVWVIGKLQNQCTGHTKLLTDKFNIHSDLVCNCALPPQSPGSFRTIILKFTGRPGPKYIHCTYAFETTSLFTNATTVIDNTSRCETDVCGRCRTWE